MRRFFAVFSVCACLAGSFGAPALAADAATAAPVLPLFGTTPWGYWSRPGADRWDGNYLRMSSGVSVTSFRKGPTIAGPTIGLETGRLWRSGQWVYGLGVEADYMPGATRFSRGGAFPFHSRDFAGITDAKAGYLVRPDLLVYGSVGAMAVSETLRLAGGRSDSRFTVRPFARAGAHWAVTDNLSLTVEVGVQQPR